MREKVRDFDIEEVVPHLEFAIPGAFLRFYPGRDVAEQDYPEESHDKSRDENEYVGCSAKGSMHTNDYALFWCHGLNSIVPEKDL